MIRSREFLAGSNVVAISCPTRIPVLLLILFLVVVSIVASLAGVSAAHPTEIDPQTGSQRVIFATSLLSAENIARLWIEMPKTFTHPHPLGYVLVVMLGAGLLSDQGCLLPPCELGCGYASALLTPSS